MKSPRTGEGADGDENEKLKLGDDGKPLLKRFCPEYVWKRPIDVKVGPDGCLYVIEYGSYWDGNPDSETRFVYDGWNVLAELTGASGSAAVRSYLWGSDLSGTIQGAGGVGGLLAIRDTSTGISHFVGFDGNGNVSLLADGSTGAVSGKYEYGPFGELIRATGPMAKLNPFRFSTKYQDDETGLLYYGCRFYNPSTGRWPSRDPMEERGGKNLYAFVNNNPITLIDALGQRITTQEKSPAFKDAIVEALDQLTGSDLVWVCWGLAGNYEQLRIKKAGSGSMWSELSWGLNDSFHNYKMIRISETDNAYERPTAHWWNREIHINENVNVALPVDNGVDANGVPQYQDEICPFAVVLWHELVGHGIEQKMHPTADWNVYANRNSVPLPSGWGTTDPTIIIEDQARAKLGLRNRRPQYYDTKPN